MVWFHYKPFYLTSWGGKFPCALGSYLPHFLLPILYEVNNDNWLQAKVIFVTVYLNDKDALDVFSSTSGVICNMLKASDALLLIMPIIDKSIIEKPVITITHKAY